jgi:hypothetical protein
MVNGINEPRHLIVTYRAVLAGVVTVAGIIYTGIHLADDLSVVRDTRAYPYILLGIALLIAESARRT